MTLLSARTKRTHPATHRLGGRLTAPCAHLALVVSAAGVAIPWFRTGAFAQAESPVGKNGYYPFIDVAAGGSIDGMVRAADANIARAADKTIVVPGAGPAGGRPQLIEDRGMLSSIRANVSALKPQGTSAPRVTSPWRRTRSGRRAP
jgi:hypothetical protein